MRAILSSALGLCLVSLGGCAIAAGYDFGKYHEGAGSAAGSGAGGSSASSDGGAGPNCGTGGTSGQGGAAPLTIQIMAPAVPRAVAVDDAFIYWVDGVTKDMKDSVLHRALKKDGSMSIALVPPQTGMFNFAVDVAYVYYAVTNVLGQNDLYKVKQSSPGMPELVFNTMQNVGGLAIHGGNLYWTTQSGVFSMPTPDGFPMQPVVKSIAQPGAIAVDDTGIYWIDQGLDGTKLGAVYRADLDGKNQKQLAKQQNSPIALSTSCADVFWTTIDGGVFGVGKAGVATFTYAQPGAAPLVGPGVTADGARVYFPEGSSVIANPFGKVAPVSLAQGLMNPGAITADGDAVYFTTTLASGGGAIVRASK